MKDDLICRSVVCDMCGCKEGDFFSPCLGDNCLVHPSNTPAVDAVEVVHGQWEKAHINGYLKCNCCEDAFIYADWLESGKWNYCPNCGAKMDGGEEK